MRTIDLIIPTRNRLKKLLRTLATIPESAAGVGIRIAIVCDGDPETAKALMERPERISRLCYVSRNLGNVYCRNLMTQTAEDAVLYGTDDITFHPGAIDRAVEAMRAIYPDDDGVVGFHQENHGHYSRAGVALVGHKFLLRYPEKKLFFPGYFHFACQEIARAGDALGKITLCREAVLTHHHPMQFPDQMDATHVEARRYRARDHELSNKREALGLIWGIGAEVQTQNKEKEP